MTFVAPEQKSRHDAKVVADLDRHIQSPASILEPISKMDRSKISPDLDTDVQALFEYALITTFHDLLPMVLTVSCLSLFPNGRMETLVAFSINFLIKAEAETKYIHWQKVSSVLWMNFRFVCVWNWMFGERSN